jgi:hypothetical protein
MDVQYNNSLDDAMKNYVSTLETRWINKLKESNEELSDSNRIMSSRIDTSFPVPRGNYFDLLPALPLNNCILDYEEENVMIEIPDYRSIYCPGK